MNTQIENNFKYHAPKPEQTEKYTKGERTLALVDDLCPNSREKSLALTNLEQAVKWANAA
ncbi:DUF7681 family protein [Paenibacillus larvae]|uniref:Acb2/Tad1 domain-containing protein n=1 Tax=Paenibacillus larvae TaxID=1464 RepID=UPI003B586213